MGASRTDRAFSSTKIADVTAAVQALCVIFNSSAAYRTKHAVFRKTVEERMPVLQRALKGLNKISLVFAEGHVRVGAVSIEPGSALFQKLSQQLESMGVTAISFLRGISADDVIALSRILTDDPELVADAGLQELLKRKGVNTILEQKVRVHADHEAGARQLATREAAGRGKRLAAARHMTRSRVLELGAESETRVFTLQRNEDAYTARHFGAFVESALGALSRKEAPMDDVVSIISTEFERRLADEIQRMRRDDERRIRHMEIATDLVLREFETVKVAAVVLDSKLNVLACNPSGRRIIGKAKRLDSILPIEELRSVRDEKQRVKINGVARTAHLLASSAREGGDTIMLISLE